MQESTDGDPKKKVIHVSRLNCHVTLFEIITKVFVEDCKQFLQFRTTWSCVFYDNYAQNVFAPDFPGLFSCMSRIGVLMTS